MRACVGVVWACSISSLWIPRCDKPAAPSANGASSAAPWRLQGARAPRRPWERAETKSWTWPWAPQSSLAPRAPSGADRKDLPVWSMALPSWRVGCFHSRCGRSPCTQLMWHLGQLINSTERAPQAPPLQTEAPHTAAEPRWAPTLMKPTLLWFPGNKIRAWPSVYLKCFPCFKAKCFL